MDYEQQTRLLVLERDGYKCVLCHQGQVQIHEIVPRSRFGKLQSDILFNPKNRVCLCPKCHAVAHNFNHRKNLLQLLKRKYNYSYDEKEYKRYFDD